MRLMIFSDAWHPQVNGVVRSLTKTIEHLDAEVKVISPSKTLGSSWHAPGYQEILLTFPSVKRLQDEITNWKPTHIHISVEGPIGLQAARACKRLGLRFTTAYHTRFPEYLRQRGIPKWLTYMYAKWFHGQAARTFVVSDELRTELSDMGFTNLVLWSRGVDHVQFSPSKRDDKLASAPYLLYVGRVSIEKDLCKFLEIPTLLPKVIIGSGPQLATLRNQYPDVTFLGKIEGEMLAKYYASAECFVFPSSTDTFGLVMIEALASGVPVAAFPVTGPNSIVNSEVGCLHDNLAIAIDQALRLRDPKKCRKHSEKFTWKFASDQFKNNLIPV